MKLNPSITVALHSFSVFLLILLLFAGCAEEMTGTEIATVKIEFTLPSPPSPTESVDGPFCETGDILQPGESCFYPGTDIEIAVLDDGTLKMLNMFLNTRQISFENTYINDTPVTLIAHRRNDNSWEIDEVGDARDAGKLDVIVSTNFTMTEVQESIYDEELSESLKDLGIETERTTTKFLYYTKDEFALTGSFSQDFHLDPDDPRLAIEITNNTPHDLSVHLTVLVDGEVEADERESFRSRSKSLRWWTWSATNE
ncbi:MAG: hypothetical protein OXU51_11635 [Candidatus Poribacteria bacterium]|nr:hypothetical protein [Candidatus Poribacteria bacterium]